MLDIKLVIPDEVLQKILWWMWKANHEVSGFGSLDFDPKNRTYTVRDAILLKQKVGPSSAEIDPVSIGKAMYEMREQPNALKWHWHSHVDMNVFWSTDDRALIKGLGEKGWIMATVFNRKKEMKTAFYTLMDVKVMGETIEGRELFIDDIPTSAPRFIPNELCAQWDKEYDAHVSEELPPVVDGYLWPKSVKGFVQNAYRDFSKYESLEPFIDPDEHGMRYSYLFKRWVYNPIFDQALKHEEDIFEAILTMDDDEVESALTFFGDKDGEFRSYYHRAIAYERASMGMVPLDGEEGVYT